MGHDCTFVSEKERRLQLHHYLFPAVYQSLSACRAALLFFFSGRGGTKTQIFPLTSFSSDNNRSLGPKITISMFMHHLGGLKKLLPRWRRAALFVGDWQEESGSVAD